MLQTVKIAKLRAGMDPDRSESNHGFYFGSNMPHRYARVIGWGNQYAITRRAFRARKHNA